MCKGRKFDYFTPEEPCDLGFFSLAKDVVKE